MVASGERVLDMDGTAKGYYDWADRLKESYLGSAKFYGCCIIPKKTCVEAIAEAARSAGCTSITSIGSGPALLEWLLGEHLPVVCVDSFYTNKDDPWLIPPVRRILKKEERGANHRMTFLHSGWGGKRVDVASDSALLWSWGIMSTAIIFGYLDHYTGNCIVVIHDQTCTVQPLTLSEILKADQPDSAWKTSLVTSASTVGRPCQLTVFVRDHSTAVGAKKAN